MPGWCRHDNPGRGRDRLLRCPHRGNAAQARRRARHHAAGGRAALRHLHPPVPAVRSHRRAQSQRRACSDGGGLCARSAAARERQVGAAERRGRVQRRDERSAVGAAGDAAENSRADSRGAVRDPGGRAGRRTGGAAARWYAKIEESLRAGDDALAARRRRLSAAMARSGDGLDCRSWVFFEEIGFGGRGYVRSFRCIIAI